MRAYPIAVRNCEEAQRLVGYAIEASDTFTGVLWAVATEEGKIMAFTGCGAKAEENARRIAAMEVSDGR